MYIDLISDINQSLEINLSQDSSLNELRQKLSLHINELINHDFQKLVSLLYRIDVNENKMRNLMEQKEGENASGLIADLIIERQLEKIRSRKKSSKDDSIPDADRW